MKLSKKLNLSFIFSILISILIISLISNIMINRRFENYLVSEREDKFERIHKEINDLLIKNDFYLDEMDFMHYALSEDINLTIKNNDGSVLFASGNRMGMGMGGMMGHGMMNRMRRIPQGNYVEKPYPLTNGNNNLGTLIIGYMDNSYLTDSALIFKSTLTQSFVISGIFTILIGLIISIGLSKSLTSPLLTISNTANKIRSGDLSARSNVNSNTSEIVNLSDSINYLGSTLSRQEEIRRRYASDISHELRTPLTTLKTHLEAIIDGVWEPTNEHLDILMEEISRLSNLVDDLKDTFRQEEFVQVLNKSRFIISKELENIVTSFLPLYSKEGFEIETLIEDNIEGLMDRDKFKQIVNNLLSNSLRYLNKNGKVIVNLSKKSNTLVLIIEDNGIGIKSEDLPYLFERFYRVDTSRDKTTGGTGLGLSIVKSIVDAHNGSINIESEYGKGTVIKITIPLE